MLSWVERFALTFVGDAVFLYEHFKSMLPFSWSRPLIGRSGAIVLVFIACFAIAGSQGYINLALMIEFFGLPVIFLIISRSEEFEKSGKASLLCLILLAGLLALVA